MTPGLHHGIPLAEYLSWPILSQSVLKEGLNSMAHLHAAEQGEREKIPTDDMLLGSALHTCFLEPELMPEHVVLWDGPRRAGKEWEAFRDQHAQQVILTAGMYASLVGMVKSLRRHPFVREWAGRIDATEVCAVGQVEGVRMKGRTDALTPEPLVDLKKVRSGDPRTFTNAVLAYGYHVQAWIYRQLFERERFALVTVEDSPPYDVCVYELSPGFVRSGERTAKALLERYKECVASGVWPGRSDQVVTLEPPPWLIENEPMGVVDSEIDDRAVVMLGGLDAFKEN